MDFDYDIYSREIYTTTDLLSDIGGIWQSIFFLGTLIVAMFREKMFYSQLIENVYQTKPGKIMNQLTTIFDS
jgi:hypothetical protein